MMNPDPDHLVELTIFEHEFIAQLLVNRLEENNLKAEIFAFAGENLGLLTAKTAPHAGAQVLVRAVDLKQAEKILEEFNQEAQASRDAVTDDDSSDG